MDPTNVKDGLVDFEGVEIAAFPCRDNAGRDWSVGTADDLAANFAEHGGKDVKVPLVLVHEEKDPKTGAALPVVKSGMPAFGWIAGVRKVVTGAGVKLLADFRRVPEKVAALIQKGAYRRVSSSWWPDGGKVGHPGADGKPVLRHVALLGADIPVVKTLQDVADLFGVQDAPTAAFSEPADAEVVSMAEVAPQANVAAPGANGAGVVDATGESAAANANPAAAPPETPPAAGAANLAEVAPAAAPAPGTLKDAIQAQSVSDEFFPLFNAIQDRMWVIRDRKGKTREEILTGLEGLGQELARIAGLLQAQAGPAPSALQAAAASMSETSQAAVATFVARLTGQGRLKPKHAPALKALAAASFAHGGDEAVASFLDDEDARRSAKVLDLGEQGKAGVGGAGGDAANFAEAAAGGRSERLDPVAAAAAEAEWDRSGGIRGLGVTKEQFVRARAGR